MARYAWDRLGDDKAALLSNSAAAPFALGSGRVAEMARPGPSDVGPARAVATR